MNSEHSLNNVLLGSYYSVESESDIRFYICEILGISEPESNTESKTDFEILEGIFTKLLNQSNEMNPSKPGFSFLLEEYYVDHVYRDSYYFYFSGKHSFYNRFCKRIILFCKIFDDSNEKKILDLKSEDLEFFFVGSIVIRPLPRRSIGRTLLNPFFFKEFSQCFVRLANYNITVFGKRLSVCAFPYSMQDGETTTCAEVTILNLLDYFSHCYPEYHYLLPSDINNIAKANGFERSIPTHGLKYEVMSKIFCETGFYPRLYSCEKMHCENFLRILYYYIESGIPVSMGVSVHGKQIRHSVIVIGHGEVGNKNSVRKLYSCLDPKSGNSIFVSETVDYISKLCVVDDCDGPYKLLDCKLDNNKNKIVLDGEYTVETMLVPLYKKMYLEATDASDIFRIILASDEFGIKNVKDLHQYFDVSDDDCKKSLEYGTGKNLLAIRIFLTSSRSLRKCRDEQFIKAKSDARGWYCATLFPRFVWVCEISVLSENSNKVIGEIILDATASPESCADSLIIVHYPHRIFCNLPKDIKDLIKNGDSAIKPAEEDDDLLFYNVEKWNSFEPYDSNLYSK